MTITFDTAALVSIATLIIIGLAVGAWFLIKGGASRTPTPSHQDEGIGS